MPLQLKITFKFFFLLFIVLIAHGLLNKSYSQLTDTIKSIELEEVVVKAFEQNRRLKDIPASVQYISKGVLERFSPTSVVHAMNTLPGVRMEERSPGSYRFNIRGSTLRSPFGVRNVKIYYNDLPFTDPGGFTFFNQLGYYNFNSVEVIKGPGSSLYGAGTGGVLLIDGLSEIEKKGLLAEYTTGSFGLHNIYGAVTTGNESAISKIGFHHQQNNGYRDHSALKRNALSWNGRFVVNDKNILKTTFLYSDLFYETPGALTRQEYEMAPRSARPGNPAFPGAETAQASVREKTFFAGASYNHNFNSSFQNKTSLYGSFTQLRNPTIQNFGRTSEPHAGGRTSFNFTIPLYASFLNINTGLEWQQGFNNIHIHRNAGGTVDTLRTLDEINTRQSFVFTQASLDIADWVIIAGASYNQRKLQFQRVYPIPLPQQEKEFDNRIAPRLSIMKKFKNINVYSTISQGFSPPTTEELLPTGGAINLDLDAEVGTNIDAGVRATLKKLYVDVNAFYFRLQNTIVLRRTAGGGNYYLNAGRTKQYGLETYISHPLFSFSDFFSRGNWWLSHTWHSFKYADFIQADNDYSGNRLPGVAPHTISTGFNIQTKAGLLSTISYYYNSKTTLTDANNEFGNSFNLLSAKAGFQKQLKSYNIKLVAGVENILDQTYSLGNDLNAFGGRYFNASPGRNYYATLSFQYNK